MHNQKKLDSMRNMHNLIQSVLIKYEWGLLAVVILLGVLIRLYGINQPLVESHQVRQVQTAMMARNLCEDHLNIFHTRLDMLGNVPGYVILEFPLMHGITALLYYLFGVHEVIGRLVSVAFSLGAMFLMYSLARQFLPLVGAFAALVLYVFSPMNIFFSRAFMPESSMMFFIVGALYFFLRWLDKKNLTLYLTAIIFAAFAYLTKPTAGVILAPILTAWFLKEGVGIFKRANFWLYILFTMLPMILWGAYANYFNSRINFCTFSYTDTWLQVIRARGIVKHWFELDFYKFVGGSIILPLLTPLGFLGMVLGFFCVRDKRHRLILFSYLGAVICYFFILSGCVIEHYYYHLHLLPVGAIFSGFAIERLLAKRALTVRIFKRKLLAILGTIIFVLAIVAYGLGYVKFFKYMYSNRMPYVLEVSEIIKKNVPENRFLIDAGSGLLTGIISYYSHSKSLPRPPNINSIIEIENLRLNGATTYVSMESVYGSTIPQIKERKELWAYLHEKCKPIAVNDHYIIFDLRDTKNIKQ